MSFAEAGSNQNPNDHLATAPAISSAITICSRRRRSVRSVCVITPAQQQVKAQQLAARTAATGSGNAASIGENQKLNLCHVREGEGKM